MSVASPEVLRLASAAFSDKGKGAVAAACTLLKKTASCSSLVSSPEKDAPLRPSCWSAALATSEWKSSRDKTSPPFAADSSACRTPISTSAPPAASCSVESRRRSLGLTPRFTCRTISLQALMVLSARDREWALGVRQGWTDLTSCTSHSISVVDSTWYHASHLNSYVHTQTPTETPNFTATRFHSKQQLQMHGRC